MTDALVRMERALEQLDTRRQSGRVTNVSGLIVRAAIPAARIGELCELREPGKGRIGLADVVGIDLSLIHI